MGIEKEYPDILQNFEATVVQFWDAEPDLLDLHVIEAYEVVGRRLSKQSLGQEFRFPSNLDRRVLELSGRLYAVAEWRLLQSGPLEEGPDPVAVEPAVLVECLKRLRQSANRWNREGGRQGYLNFVSGFIPR